MTSGSTPLLDYWVVTRPMPGQSESGDQFLVAPFLGGVLIAVVDGLGHGADAAVAAHAAIGVLAAHAGEPVTALAQRCHQALRRTRGVVMSIASCHAATNSMTWLGIGNVEGMLVSATGKPASLLLRGGIVGDRLPNLLPATLPLHRGDLLFFATDGIYSAFIRDIRFTEHPHELVHRIFMEHNRSTDDALLLGGRWTSGEMMPASVEG